MPRTPDASTFTTVRRVAATFTPDPTKKSRTFVAPVKQGFLSAELRASDVEKTTRGSVLAVVRGSIPQSGRKVFSK